jgi:hypothetical protein
LLAPGFLCDMNSPFARLRRVTLVTVGDARHGR